MISTLGKIPLNHISKFPRKFLFSSKLFFRKIILLSIVAILCVSPNFSSVALDTVWIEDFDSYSYKSQIHGQGGWKGWNNNIAYGAFINSPSFTMPHSVEIAGASDLIHEFSGYTSGEWQFSTYQYIPSTMTGIQYFLLLNQYSDTGPYNWSTQVSFDPASGLVHSDFDGNTLSIVADRWVEIRIVIDLDNDDQQFYYDEKLLFDKSWTESVSGSGSLNIAALSLFANGASSIYYDHMSLELLSPSLTLSKTVGSDPNSCATTELHHR